MEAPPVSLRMVGTVAVLAIDHPPVNALSLAVRRALLAALEALDPAAEALVLTGTATRFVGGADVKEMRDPPTDPSVAAIVDALERVRPPTFAAVSGPALGGGLELALACDLRLATPAATFGLPETRLGLVPGAGGTQRLPRLVGVAKAIELVGEARIVGAEEALALGVVDRVVDGDVVGAAVALAGSVQKRRVSDLPVPVDGAERIEAAAKAATRRARGVPAVARAVALVREAAVQTFAAGLARERAAFLELRDSPEAAALRHLFLAEREAAKVPGLQGVAPRPVDRVAVVGAGTMGSAIAVSLADAGIPVDLLERDLEAARAGSLRVRGIYERQVQSGRLSHEAAELRGALVQATDDWDRVAAADLVVEAAFEAMDVKIAIFARLDALAKPGAVLATNTSYLDVNAIAAATSRPQDVLGLHFFAPANVTRLVEVVVGDATAPEVLQTALSLGRRIGKLPVVARVCEGFIGNRVFSAYRRHAEYLVEDGASPWQVDAALEAYGFAMGPFATSDLAGLDIGQATRRRLAPTRDPGQRTVAIADRLCDAGRLGRKSGLGWYDYTDGTRRPDPWVDAVVARERAAKHSRMETFTAEQIQRRILAVMANEGAKILAEGVSLRASDVDVVFVHGYGFPRVRGGPMFAASRLGLDAVLAEVEDAARVGGAGSEPAALLIELAAGGGCFT